MERDIKKVPTLRGARSSTCSSSPPRARRTSFELAGKRLSADVVNVKGSGSSIEKGETLKDTVITLDAYAPDVLVMRHAVGRRLPDRDPLHRRRRGQRGRRQARAPHPDPARPLHDRARGGAPRRPAHRVRRRRRALARRPLGHPRLPDDGRPRDADRAADAVAPRRRGGARGRDLHRRHRRPPTPTSSTSCACSSSAWARAASCPRCASTRPPTASTTGACAPASA